MLTLNETDFPDISGRNEAMSLCFQYRQTKPEIALLFKYPNCKKCLHLFLEIFPTTFTAGLVVFFLLFSGKIKKPGFFIKIRKKTLKPLLKIYIFFSIPYPDEECLHYRRQMFQNISLHQPQILKVIVFNPSPGE